MTDTTYTLVQKGTAPDLTATGVIAGRRRIVPRRGQEVSYTFDFADGGDFAELREYLDFADAAAYGTSITSVPYFREQLPSAAPVDSLVLKIVPSADLRGETVDGVWGLVVGGSDDRLPSLTRPRLTLNVFVLAEASEYADHTAVFDALAA